MRILIFFVVFLFSSAVFSQSIPRVRTYLDSLCSPKMHGRGADLNGDSIAADFLKRQFETFGLKPFGGKYLQYFNYDINTFPGDCYLRLGNRKFKAGEEFIVNSNSSAGKAKSKYVLLDTMIFHSEAARMKFVAKDMSKKVFVYHSKYKPRMTDLPVECIHKIQEAACIIELDKKLTAGLSGYQIPKPSFRLLETYSLPQSGKCKYKVDASLISDHKSQNVIAFVEGKLKPDSFIVISAHYDHLGTMGKNTYFPGANDNASGVSMLLELARYYSSPENKPDCSIAFMAFGAEEAGLIGSKHYVDNPIFSLKKIKFLINLDLLGTGDDGIMVVNGALHSKYFNRITAINNSKGLVKEVKKRGAAANSDHYYFSEAGVPAFFIYTLGGIAAYHDVFDVPQTLPLTDFEDVFKLLTSFVRELEE